MNAAATSAVAGMGDQMKMAREHALLGNYEASLVYFDGVIATIKQHMRSLDDPHLRTQWTKAKDELTAEFRVVKDITIELARFKDPPAGAVAGGGSGAAGSSEQWEEHPARPTGPSPPRSGMGPGGGYDQGNGGGYGGGHGGGYDAPQRTPPPYDPADDPDVWPDPPPQPERPERRAPPPRRAPQNTHTPDPPSWAARGGGGGREPPARNTPSSRAAPARGTPGNGARGGAPAAAGGGRRTGERKPGVPKRPEKAPAKFGDGAPPAEKELIEGIERDILEGTPNVHWDDIAGLEEAKRVLEEARSRVTSYLGDFY
jgi:katanin p60 ATPase-containing subunit A1